jgi:hypothetical protein
MREPTLIPGSPSPQEHTPPSVIDDDGDRVSVTDVNGTVARFEMTYSPPVGERLKFGPPLAARIPSAIYLAAALVLGALVLYAYTTASSNSLIFVWVVEKDRGRPVSADVLTVIVVISALATVLRTHMRGVLVSDDWVEARYLLALGIPRARRWAWTQVHRIVLDGTRVAFELWDGSFDRLPEVAKGRELVDLILQHAQSKRIAVTVLDPSTRR